MANKYHILVLRDNDGEWFLEFGAYDKGDVREEQRYYRNLYAAKNMQIISLDSEDYSVIHDAVAALNKRK